MFHFVMQDALSYNEVVKIDFNNITKLCKKLPQTILKFSKFLAGWRTWFYFPFLSS